MQLKTFSIKQKIFGGKDANMVWHEVSMQIKQIISYVQS